MYHILEVSARINEQESETAAFVTRVHRVTPTLLEVLMTEALDDTDEGIKIDL